MGMAIIRTHNALPKKKHPKVLNLLELLGGGAGIRTLDASFSSHTPLAGEPLQPLGHASKPSANISMRQA
jgi:hypothetical protein